MTGLPTTVERWANVVRYHRPSQLLRRLGKRTLEPLHWVRRAKPSSAPPPLRNCHWEIPKTAAFTNSHECDLETGRFTFLNLCANLGNPIDWDLCCWADAPALWAFQLHYHEFLEALDPDGEPVWPVLLSWCDAYPASNRNRYRVAWHPYCTARRIPVWCRLLVRNCLPLADSDRLITELAAQAEYLSRHLERDIGGNHLWENAKALVTAGCFFQGPNAGRWLEIGVSELLECLTKQILPSGEHYERSPMYQADMARGLIDVASWLEPVDPGFAQTCRSEAGRMSAFLDALRHPDGSLPQFGDTSSATCNSLEFPNRACDSQSSWVGQYFIHARDDDRLIFDAGNVGPDDLPAHAHSDLLGFELCLFGKRAVIDSGVFCYAGSKRMQYRRSAAHSVLTIDDVELADVWSSFRMGRRGHIVDRAWGQIDGNVWVRAAHDAYAHLGLSVDRYWLFPANGPWFSVHVVRGSSAASHRFCERVLWHPQVELTPQDSSRRFAVSIDGQHATWLCASHALASLDVAGYSPDFYVEADRPAIQLDLEGTAPALVAWCIGRGDKLEKAQTALDGRWLIAAWITDGEPGEWIVPVV